MKGLLIERHNEAVACVSKAVMEGRKGGCLTAMMVDAEQHQQLITHLKEAGYADVKLHLLIFDSTGGIFHLTAQDLKQLGITGPPRKTLLENFHFRALKRLEQLAGTCRRLKHQPNEPNNRKRKRDEYLGWALAC